MKRKTYVSATVCIIILVLSIGLFGRPPQVTFRSDVSIVNINFNALDKKGDPVNGLEAGDFQIFENGEPQTIEFFSETGKREDVLLTIALIIDTSGSVKDKLSYEINTASEFFREILRPEKDLALIIQFDSEVNLVQDYTQDLNRLENALNSLRAGGETSLYDAVYLAAEEKLRYEAGRKVMVVISDGEDTGSLVSKEEAIEAAQMEKCSQCHHPLKKEGNAMKLQTAYHVNCKNCHKTLAECNESAGPYRKCYGCHEKD